MKAQLSRSGKPKPKVIGVDEVSIRRGHTYRIVVTDLERGRPIWFGGKDRSEESLIEFFAELGKPQSARIRLAVMDMWKPFRNATEASAPQAAILYDKFHVMRHLGEALDRVRKSEYGRLVGLVAAHEVGPTQGIDSIDLLMWILPSRVSGLELTPHAKTKRGQSPYATLGTS
ncbi:MAG TPA: transposase [Candidatus Binatia bacterium]|jgi:transposase